MKKHLMYEMNVTNFVLNNVILSKYLVNSCIIFLLNFIFAIL